LATYPFLSQINSNLDVEKKKSMPYAMHNTCITTIFLLLCFTTAWKSSFRPLETLIHSLLNALSW
jgi:hypothetical protein